MERNRHLRKVTQVALLVALAVVVSLMFAPILVITGAMVRINASHTIAQLVPIIFGPIYGGIASGMANLIAYVIRPQGAWLWHITVLEIFCGILLGVLWKVVRIRHRFTKLLVLIFIVDMIYSTLNTLGFIMFLPAMQGMGFLVALTPRLLVAVALVVPKACVMMVLLNVYERYIARGERV